MRSTASLAARRLTICASISAPPSRAATMLAWRPSKAALHSCWFKLGIALGLLRARACRHTSGNAHVRRTGGRARQRGGALVPSDRHVQRGSVRARRPTTTATTPEQPKHRRPPSNAASRRDDRTSSRDEEERCAAWPATPGRGRFTTDARDVSGRRRGARVDRARGGGAPAPVAVTTTAFLFVGVFALLDCGAASGLAVHAARGRVLSARDRDRSWWRRDARISRRARIA